MDHIEKNYEPVENHGIIGNLQTVAMVALSGTIDFMCFPDFDSPTLFASLLDSKKGGYFSIEPELKDCHSKQLYIPDTAVLLTRFFSEDGIAEVTDYMPMPDADGHTVWAIVRKIKTIRGRIRFRVRCVPRMNYARDKHTATHSRGQILFTGAKNKKQQVKLMADVPLKIENGDGYAEFVLEEAGTAHFVLEAAREKLDVTGRQLKFYAEESYTETVRRWRKWANKSSYRGHNTGLVRRSAITLKLLTSVRHGSVIAAATFGVPEMIGGRRNWDYRYTWIRDGAFTMYAFLTLGYTGEAKAFMDWISRLSSDESLQLLYTIDGTKTGEETVLSHLDGYRSTRPVRIGNAAAQQTQLDIYGELIDTIYIYDNKHKPITYAFWKLVEKQVECVVKNWKKPDHGIWEVRAGKKQFLHSRLMSWVAMDRAIKIAEHRSFPYPKAKWQRIRDEIYLDVYDNFWNGKKKAWVQSLGSDRLDASVLLMPLTHFISPLEPRWLSTMDAVGRELGLDVLIYRYQIDEKNNDGIDGEEGTFNMCSFWYIEALAKSGRVDEAVENFEKMIGYSNHLGLFSEELGKKGEQLGNFPQAFTHLALISAAVEIDKQLKRREGTTGYQG